MKIDKNTAFEIHLLIIYAILLICFFAYSPLVWAFLVGLSFLSIYHLLKGVRNDSAVQGLER